MKGARLDAGGNCLRSGQCSDLYRIGVHGKWWSLGGSERVGVGT